MPSLCKPLAFSVLCSAATGFLHSSALLLSSSIVSVHAAQRQNANALSMSSGDPYERVKQSIWDTDGSLEYIFENNKKWVEQVTAEDPEVFTRLKHSQAPKYLYIGCSDSRSVLLRVHSLIYLVFFIVHLMPKIRSAMCAPLHVY
jgi:hypothetical protein